MLHGAVKSERGVAVPGVQISVFGSRKSAISDSAGRFQIVGLPSGELQLLARRVGYQPTTVAVVTGSARSIIVDLIMKRVVGLDTVSVTASAIIPSFEEHRSLGSDSS